MRVSAFGLVLVTLFALVACSAGTPPDGVADQVSRPEMTTLRLPPPSYPLRIGPTRRYLVDSRGRPFLIVGDSPQALVANVSLRDADKFLADRAANGFNAVWVNLLCTTYTGGRPDGATFDHIAPFTTQGDLATPNEAYFRRADAIVRLAAKHKLTVFLDPIETGGWLGVLLDNGVKKDYAYGEWLGNRYKSFPNIVWFNGNDFQRYRDPAANAAVLAVAKGIRATDSHHIQTVQLDNYQYGTRASGSRDSRFWTPVIGVDAAYSYYPTYAQVLEEYNRPDHIPVFMVEANYEFEQEYSGSETLRRQEYWSLLSGASGSSTATTSRGNSSTAGRAISIRQACRSCSTSRSSLSTGRGSDLSPISDTSSSPPASGVFRHPATSTTTTTSRPPRPRTASSPLPTCPRATPSPSTSRGLRGRSKPSGMTRRQGSTR